MEKIIGIKLPFLNKLDYLIVPSDVNCKYIVIKYGNYEFVVEATNLEYGLDKGIPTHKKGEFLRVATNADLAKHQNSLNNNDKYKKNNELFTE